MEKPHMASARLQSSPGRHPQGHSEFHAGLDPLGGFAPSRLQCIKPQNYTPAILPIVCNYLILLEGYFGRNAFRKKPVGHLNRRALG